MTLFKSRDGQRVSEEDSWQMYRNKTAQAVSHGVADAIDGTRRDQRVNTVHTAAYWRSYSRGQRDYAEAAERNRGRS